MVRSACCDKEHTNKGAWTKQEDERLINFIKIHGEGSWKSLPKAAGLSRCGKSCRLRWINYLRPDLKRGHFSQEEEETIINLQSSIGNKWSLIAAHLPGRTDNEIKNYWNTHIKRKLIAHGINPQTTQMPSNMRNDNINPPIPSSQGLPQMVSMQSGASKNDVNGNLINFGIPKTESSTEEYSYGSSLTSFLSEQELCPQINLELSMSLPKSHEAIIDRQTMMGKNCQFHYQQLFTNSPSSSSSVVLAIANKSVCLCYNLGRIGCSCNNSVSMQ